MPAVRLILDKYKDSFGHSLLYIQLSETENGTTRRKKTSLGIKVKSKQWSAKEQIVLPSAPRAYDTNAILRALRTRCDEIVQHARPFIFERVWGDIGDVLDEILHRKTGSTDLLSLLDTFIEAHGKSRTTNTVKKFTTLKYKLKEYGTKTGTTLDVALISREYLENFHSWLLDTGNLNNTAEKTLSCFRTFVSWMVERGIRVDLSYKLARGKKHNIEVVYLTEPELMKLYYLKLNSQKLRNVRDVFCFACWTGMRYSDVAAMTEANIKDDAVCFRTHKTRDELKVPLNQYSRAILERHSYRLPVYSNVKTNKYLKELCKEAGFNSMEKIVQYRGAERIETVIPKHEAISFHDARRTFIILLLIKGVPPRVIMAMTGHSDYKSFEKYVRIADSVTRNYMNQVWG